MDPAPLNLILGLRPAVQRLVDQKVQIRDSEQAKYALGVCNEQREKAMITSVKERQRAMLESVGAAAGVGETARFALPMLARVRCAEKGALAAACARFRGHCAQLRAGVQMAQEAETGGLGRVGEADDSEDV